MLGAILGGIGSVVNGFLGRSAASEQADLQKQFAKNAIQWKVQDSLKAGIHPLYGLGANTVNYSPVSVGGPDMSWLGDMGQEIDRARMATSGAETRGTTAALESLSLERAGLENDLLRAQIAKTNAQVGPPMPGGSGALTAFGVPVSTVKGETEAQDWENRYGDFATDGVGALRLVRDADGPVTAAIRTEFSKMMNGQPNVFLSANGRPISWEFARDYLPPSWYKSDYGGR